MLYNIKTGHQGMRQTPMDEIVILVSSLPHLQRLGLRFLFTNQHAYPVSAQYFDDLSHLDAVDWKIIAARDFSRNPDDPGKIERYMAEALVYQHVPLSALQDIVRYSSTAETNVLAMQGQVGIHLRTSIRSDWYF